MNRICINHGELNPDTNYPDSICGQVFNSLHNKGCTFHQGYKKVQKGKAAYWTCCPHLDENDHSMCMSEEH